MSNKVIKEMRMLSKEELTSKVNDLEGELFQLRLKKTTGQLENKALIWKQRKSLARAKTLLSALAQKG